MSKSKSKKGRKRSKRKQINSKNAIKKTARKGNTHTSGSQGARGVGVASRRNNRKTESTTKESKEVKRKANLRRYKKQAEVCTGGDGSFQFHRRWKLPCTSMEVSADFHGGSRSTSTNLQWNFHGIRYSSTGFEKLPWKENDFHGRKLLETSTEVNRTNVGWPLRKSCGISWEFVILVEVGGSM